MKRLLTINLKGNLYIPKSKQKVAQELVADSAGASFGPEEPRDYTKPNIRPLRHILLLENVEDRCSYCKSDIAADKNQKVNCEKKLKKIVFSANSKIPKSKTEYKQIQASQSRQVIGYKNTANPYSSLGTSTVRTPAQFEKTKHKVRNLNGMIFRSLAGTVCEDCSVKFLEEVNKILKQIIVKGKIETIFNSISSTENDYKTLIRQWMSKI